MRKNFSVPDVITIIVSALVPVALPGAFLFGLVFGSQQFLLFLNSEKLKDHERNKSAKVIESYGIVQSKRVQWDGYEVVIDSKNINKGSLAVSVEEFSSIKVGDKICIEYTQYKDGSIDDLQPC